MNQMFFRGLSFLVDVYIVPVSEPAPITVDEVQHQCDICNRGCCTKQEFSVHMFIKHASKSAISNKIVKTSVCVA